jgi:hypothetical protein
MVAAPSDNGKIVDLPKRDKGREKFSEKRPDSPDFG